MQWPTPMPRWINWAFRYVGVQEIPGPRHSAVIGKWLHNLKAWWKDDETPWCGTFIAHCLQGAMLTFPSAWYRAKSYTTYGTPCNLDSIPFGAICVKERKGGGHVFFAVARSRDGNIVYGLGGNQGNKVNITSFWRKDIVAARWPVTTEVRLALPIANSSAELNAASAGGTEA